MENIFYVYIYLNPLKEGNYIYDKFSFKCEPFYVGKGKNDRCNVHLYYSNSTNKLKQNILNKIKNENQKPIIIKLYENLSEYSAHRMEMCLIKLIGRRDLNLGTLSNLSDGGEGSSGAIYDYEKRVNMSSEKRKIIQYDNNGKIIKIWKNMTEISLSYPQLRTNLLHRVCKSNGNRKVMNYFWKYLEDEKFGDEISVLDNHKPILQYDLNGNFIKKWNYAKEIHDNLCLSTGAILKCCRNNANQSLLYEFKNYMWLFKNGNIDITINSYYINNATSNSRIEKKKINMYDIDNAYIKTYTPKELKNEGFYTKTIYRCCDKKFKTTQGYKWTWA